MISFLLKLFLELLLSCGCIIILVLLTIFVKALIDLLFKN